MIKVMYPTHSQSSELTADQSGGLFVPAHRRRRLEEPPRAAIIGGGPLGLEAALYASRLGHTVLLFEREPLPAASVHAWAHVTMFTPWSDNRSPLGELALREAVHTLKQRDDRVASGEMHPTGEAFIHSYLNPLARLLGDAVHRETRVVALGRSYLFPEEHAQALEKRSARRFRLLTRSPREERIFTADYVVDASGTSHAPGWAGAGGLPALGEMGSFQHIFHHIPDVLGRDRIHFSGKKTLLIGDGASAATTAAALAEVVSLEPQGSVFWAVKSRAEMPMPLVENDPLTLRDTLFKKVNLLVKNGHPNFAYSPTTQIEAIQHSLATGRFQVTLQVNHETQRMTVDTVVAHVGSRRDAVLYERSLHPEEPDFYAIGEKVLPPGDYLLRQGHVQIRDIFRRITGQPDLDLYAQAQAKLAASGQSADTL